MSDIIHLFQEAVRKDDTDEVKTLLSKYPKLLDDISASASSDNPLLTACEHGSRQVAKEIVSLWPELACIRNQHGYTAMHVVSERGDVEMVKFLGELNPESCLIEDNFSMLPLHRAAINGNSDVIRALICTSPESLGKLTSNQDTALHLAVKNSQFDAFQVLVDETKIHNQEHLFNRKNEDGNTVLHLATFNKFVEIVKLLLLESSRSQIMIRVNSMNKQGQTALEVCNANSQDRVFNEIGLILQGAAARQQTAHFPVHQLSDSTTSGSWNLTRWTIETRNVLLMVVGTLTAFFLTVACNLPAPFLKEDYLAGKTLNAKDVIFGGLPTVVYLMVFNSAGFITTTAAIVVLGWPLHLRTILLFLVFCAFIVYVALVNEIIPKFFVRIGKSSISSIALMWSLVFATIFSGISILSFGKYTAYLWRFIHWLWTKKINSCKNIVEDLDA